MSQATRGGHSQEDWRRHDPATGTAVQTFNRTSSTGGTVSRTAISANSLPLLDAPVVSGANTPFEELVDTQAAKTVEAALATIRKNIPHWKNFEHYGGIPGSGVSAAQAQKNTDVWNQITSDIAASGKKNGIFFPGAFYKFKDSGASAYILDGRDLPQITVCGSGPGTVLQADNTSTAAAPLIRWRDGTGMRLANLTLDRNGTGANVVSLSSNAGPLGDIQILATTFIGGSAGLSLNSSGTVLSRKFWISQCYFTNAANENIALTNVSDLHFFDNTLDGGGTGLLVNSTGTDTILSDQFIGNNRFLGSSQQLVLLRGGTYNSALHRGVVVFNNRVAVGSVAVNGVDHATIAENTCYAGAIVVTMDTMTQANRIRLIGNHSVGATGPGIWVRGTAVTFDGLQILGGSVTGATQQGILIACSTAPCKRALIQNVLIEDCSREDSGTTDYSGIMLDAPNAGGGVTESIVANNIIRCTSATAVNANKHKYGVEEKSGGVSDLNFIGPNFIKGYVTADVLISGANSVDVVARYAALDTAAAGRLGSFDQGSAV